MPPKPKNPVPADSIGARLRALRGKLSQEQMASKLAVNRSHLATLETGAEVGKKVIEALLEAYPGLSVDWLLKGEGTAFGPKEAPAANAERARASYALSGFATCLLFEDATVGAGTSIAPGDQNATACCQLPAPIFIAGHKYVVATVRGDSMEPALVDGIRILIDTSIRDPQSLLGDMVVVNLRRDHSPEEGATVKILRAGKRDAGYELHPINKAHAIIKKVEPAQIVGRVAGILR